MLLALVALGLIIFVVTAIGIYAIIRNSIRLPRPHDIEASTRVFNWRDDPNMQSMTFSVSPSCPALFGIDMGKVRSRNCLAVSSSDRRYSQVGSYCSDCRYAANASQEDEDER